MAGKGKAIGVPLAAAVMIVLQGVLAAAAQPPSFVDFLKDKGLIEIFETEQPFFRAMTGRWEKAVEAEGYLYGLVIYNGKNHPVPSGLLDSFCRLALVRKKMRPLTTQISKKMKNGLLLTEIIEIIGVESTVRNFQRIGQDRKAGWSACACRVSHDDITLPDMATNEPVYLARAYYNLARRALKSGNRVEALKWFKKTRTDRQVYDNSLAFLTPLVYSLDTHLAAQIDQRYLRVNRVTDPDALAFLAEFRITRKSFPKAIAACRRCLEINPDQADCGRLLVEAKNAKAIEELAFDAFFPESQKRE